MAKQSKRMRAIEEKIESNNLFKKIEPIKKEFNPRLKIKLSELTKNKVFFNNKTNNSGNINFETNFKKKSS